MSQLTLVFLLFVIFQLKHFLADYPLQNGFMLGKSRPDWSFFVPLLSHVSVHVTFTLVIALLAGVSVPVALGVAAFDGVVHFFMDRIKAGPKYLGRFKDITKSPFWWSLGFDQMIHHLTHIAIVWVLVTQ
jgi:hypothetical protein